MDITVAAAQFPFTRYQDFKGWNFNMEKWVAEAAKQKAQQVLFPEYGSLELMSILPKEDREESVEQQLKKLSLFRSDFCTVFSDLAKKYQLVIVAPSFPVVEEGNTLNRAYVFSPKGLAGYQDKFFMTRFEGEEWGVSSAPKVLTLFEAPWGSFGVQICYDVEFSLGSKLLCSAGASFILAPSCTDTRRGSSRVHIGARARALESQAFTVVSQTVGNAPWSVVDVNYGYPAFYCAPVLDMPEDGILKESSPQEEGWLIQSLDLSHITAIRNEGRVFNFKDNQRFYTDFPDEEVAVVKKQV